MPWQAGAMAASVTLVGTDEPPLLVCQSGVSVVVVARHRKRLDPKSL